MLNTPSSSVPPRAPSIRIALRTFGRTLRHGYDNLGTLALCGILWLIGAILIIPLGPVTAALHRITLPMTEERAVSWQRFFEHFREDLGWGSRLAFSLLLGLIVIQANIVYYNNSPSQVLQLFGIVFVTLLVIWLGIMLFAFPLALRQDDRRLRTTLRNALVMVMANGPGVLLSMILLAVLTVAFILIPPLFVFVPGIVALWGQENARLLLVAGGYLPEDPIADRPRRPR